MGHRCTPAVAGYGHPGRGGRIHGQRVCADAPPGLRHAARDPRHGGPNASRPRRVRVTLLGPQRRPTLDTVVRSLDIEGPIATITAGWQEREPDDAELNEQLDGRAVNLGLYRRWLDVQDRDPGYAAADRRLRQVLEEMQDLYLLRLDHALQAVHAVQHRRGNGRIRDSVVTEAIADVRELDAQHLRHIGDVHGEFYQTWPPHDRPVIAEHRAAVERLLSEAATLVIAGGHVGVLASTLHLFNVAASLR